MKSGRWISETKEDIDAVCDPDSTIQTFQWRGVQDAIHYIYRMQHQTPSWRSLSLQSIFTLHAARYLGCRIVTDWMDSLVAARMTPLIASSGTYWTVHDITALLRIIDEFDLVETEQAFLRGLTFDNVSKPFCPGLRLAVRKALDECEDDIPIAKRLMRIAARCLA